MDGKYKIFVLNFGSTSTKIALFSNLEKVYEGKAEHNVEELAKFGSIPKQTDYRVQCIMEKIEEAELDMEGIDAVAARCGGTGAIPGGTYEVNDVLIKRLTDESIPHNFADLGGAAAEKLARLFGGRAFIVDSPETDEFQPMARITGMKNVFKMSSSHALNQKAVCRYYAESQGKQYEDLNLVVAHMGGGVSVTAHRKGKMIDSTNIIHGDGPMTPTRTGAMPVIPVVRMAYSGQYTEKELIGRINAMGGLQDHLGTTDIREIKERIKAGDWYAELIYRTFIYQIGKYIGMYSTVLNGDVDQIILTGGISNDEYLVGEIRKMCGYISGITAIPGEFEMEALAAGAYRVLTGREEPKIYTGKLVFNDRIEELQG